MNILTLSPIDACALAELTKRHHVIRPTDTTPAAVLPLLPEVDIVILRSGVVLNRDMVAAATRLRLVIRAGSGVDNIALEELAVREISLLRIPRPGARAVAEMSFALMLALARNLLTADRTWRAGQWRKHELTGTGLAGKVLGIYGAGNIGTQVGLMGAAWGMRPIGCVRAPTREEDCRLAEHGIRMAGSEEVLTSADFLSIHVPGNFETQHLIDRAAVSRMKLGAYLINLARGGVVDERAVRDALVAGRLRGAAFDVHAVEEEGAISVLAGLPNVVLTPHIGAATADAQREIGRQIVAAVDELERGPVQGNGRVIPAAHHGSPTAMHQGG